MFLLLPIEQITTFLPLSEPRGDLVVDKFLLQHERQFDASVTRQVFYYREKLEIGTLSA